jgi:hypothetical protein
MNHARMVAVIYPSYNLIVFMLSMSNVHEYLARPSSLLDVNRNADKGETNSRAQPAKIFIRITSNDVYNPVR